MASVRHWTFSDGFFIVLPVDNTKTVTASYDKRIQIRFQHNFKVFYVRCCYRIPAIREGAPLPCSCTRSARPSDAPLWNCSRCVLESAKLLMRYGSPLRSWCALWYSLNYMTRWGGLQGSHMMHWPHEAGMWLVKGFRLKEHFINFHISRQIKLCKTEAHKQSKSKSEIWLFSPTFYSPAHTDSTVLSQKTTLVA